MNLPETADAPTVSDVARRMAPVPVALLLALASPLPTMRLVWLVLATALILTRGYRVHLSERATGLAALCCALATLGPEMTWGGRSDDAAVRALTVVAVLAWAWLAARPLSAERVPSRSLLATCGVAAFGVSIQIGTLLAPIAWRGDEDNNIYRTIKLLQVWQEQPAVLVAAVALAAGLALVLRVRTGSVPLALALAAGLAVGTSLAGWRGLGWDAARLLLRQPVLATLGQALFATCPWALLRPELQLESAWYRLLPLTAVLLLGLAAFTSPRLNLAQGALVAVAFWSVPVVRYYAALSYIEPLLCAGMVLALHSVNELAGHESLPRGPGYLALLALPWLKPTVLPFCIVVSIYLVGRAVGNARPRREVLSVAGITLLPVAIGILWLGGARLYQPEISLLLPSTLAASARLLLVAIWEQYGPFAIAAALGLAVTWRRGDRAFALLVSALVVCYLLFFQLDGHSVWRSDGVRLPAYLGHSRFLLMLLPPLCALAWQLLVVLSARPFALAAALCAGLGFGAFQSPVAFSGERQPFWGDYAGSTAEFLYPYDELLRSLAGDRKVVTVRVVGASYPYFVSFYERRYRAAWLVSWERFDERFHETSQRKTDLGIQSRRESLLRALQHEPDAVVLHLAPLDESSLWPAEIGGYSKQQEFRRGTARLVLFRRGDAGLPAAP